jgi:hypothetical protein
MLREHVSVKRVVACFALYPALTEKTTHGDRSKDL